MIFGLLSMILFSFLYAAARYFFGLTTAAQYFALIMFIGMDATINIVQTPLRALLSDLTSSRQQAGEAVYSLFVSLFLSFLLFLFLSLSLDCQLYPMSFSTLSLFLSLFLSEGHKYVLSLISFLLTEQLAKSWLPPSKDSADLWVRRSCSLSLMPRENTCCQWLRSPPV